MCTHAHRHRTRTYAIVSQHAADSSSHTRLLLSAMLSALLAAPPPPGTLSLCAPRSFAQRLLITFRVPASASASASSCSFLAASPPRSSEGPDRLARSGGRAIGRAPHERLTRRATYKPLERANPALRQAAVARPRAALAAAPPRTVPIRGASWHLPAVSSTATRPHGEGVVIARGVTSTTVLVVLLVGVL